MPPDINGHCPGCLMQLTTPGSQPELAIGFFSPADEWLQRVLPSTTLPQRTSGTLQRHCKYKTLLYVFDGKAALNP